MYESTTTADEFQRRLAESLNRVRSRPAVTEPDGSPSAADEFEERLRRAVAASGRDGRIEEKVANDTRGPTRLDGLPPDLQTVVECWPQLPGFVRAFILNMVYANGESQAA
jgi:hypothetical protein